MPPFNTRGLAVIAALALAQPCSGQMGMMGQRPGYRCCGPMRQGQPMQGSMSRHRLFMMDGIGPRYQGKVNPVPSTGATLAAGEKLYGKNCAACHGATGLGDGEAGRMLWPRPANIAASSKMPMASDAYLYWTISEGGQPVGSAMPAFKQSLREDEIWEIIGYLRSL
ncbi:MAG: c-type cytochrome [Telluria sp.]